MEWSISCPADDAAKLHSIAVLARDGTRMGRWVQWAFEKLPIDALIPDVMNE